MRFSKKVEDFFKNIDKLPDELINIVQTYIPKTVTMFLTKAEYIENHRFIRNYINKLKIEDYIRSMVRQDNEFVFRHLLNENYERWLSMRKYYYKACIYANYLFFLEAYALEFDAPKCRYLMLSLFEVQGLCKNQHKKKVSKYIRWTT
jgi:hypothetical protein